MAGDAGDRGGGYGKKRLRLSRGAREQLRVARRVWGRHPAELMGARWGDWMLMEMMALEELESE